MSAPPKNSVETIVNAATPAYAEHIRKAHPEFSDVEVNRIVDVTVNFVRQNFSPSNSEELKNLMKAGLEGLLQLYPAEERRKVNGRIHSLEKEYEKISDAEDKGELSVEEGFKKMAAQTGKIIQDADALSKLVCASCSTPNKLIKKESKTDFLLKRCTRCFEVAYCSRTCQTRDWPTHKAVCKKN